MGSEPAHDDAPDLEDSSGLDVRTRLAEALDAIRRLNDENRRLRARVASLEPRVAESAPPAPEADYVNSTSAANTKIGLFRKPPLRTAGRLRASLGVP